MNTDELYPHLVPFSNNKEDFEELLRLSKEDNHSCLFPTEVVIKGSEKVGWVSCGVIPTALFWLSTKKVKVRDTIQVLNTVEGVQRRLGAPGLFLPCFKESPFHPYLSKIGYTNNGPFDMFFKRF